MFLINIFIVVVGLQYRGSRLSHFRDSPKFNLTEFCASGLYLDEVLQVLTPSPQLITCDQFEALGIRPPELGGYRSIVHSHLEVLILEIDIGWASEEEDATVIFFAKATFPSLRVFQLHSGHAFPATAFLSFLARSSCSIVKLSIKKSIIAGEDLTEIAKALPSITYLKLSNYYASVIQSQPLDTFYRTLCQESRYVDHIAGHSSPNIVILPALESLSIWTNRPFAWALLPGIYHRYEHNAHTSTNVPGRPGVKYINIDFHRYEADHIVEDQEMECDEDDPKYFPADLIESWETVSELMELGKNVALNINVTDADYHQVDLPDISYRKLEATVGRAPKHIQESDAAKSWAAER